MTFFYVLFEIGLSFVECFTGFKLISFLLIKQEKKIPGIWISIAYALILYILQRNALYNSYLAYVVTFLISILYSIFYSAKFGVVLAITSFYMFIIISLTEMTGIIVMSIYTDNEVIGKILISEMSMLRVLYCLAMKSIQFGIYLLIKRIINNRKKILRFLTEYYKIILIISLLNYFGSYFLSNFLIREINTHVIANWFSYVVVILLCGIAFALYIRLKLANEKRDLIEIRNQVLEENYGNLKQVYDHQAKSAHDFKNHINVIYKYTSEQNTEAILSYLKEISPPVSMSDMECWTGNQIIDLILNHKFREAQDKGIRMNIETKIYPIGISDKDINSVLSNLLDNAIEAAEPVKEERWIDIMIKSMNEMLIIKIRNAHNNVIQKRGRKFLTNKPDKKIHGLGIDIVKDVVSKYDGYININYDDHEFEVLLGMPVMQDDEE